MEDGIFVHPENGLNGLICNWCIGGYWFTPAQKVLEEQYSPMSRSGGAYQLLVTVVVRL